MKEIHLICNAHIDPIWQWDWQEGVSAVLSTFRSACDLADSFDYIFCHNEVTVYKYVEEYAPELFKRIQDLVNKGKWRIMGGWYLQPDCNMPNGESFIRQILKGKEYFMEKFGVFPQAATNFDPFGHTRGLVQIIKKCGQDGYIFMRPYAHECKLEEEQFIWEGFDGSKIKATRCCSYNTPLGGAAKEIKKRADSLNYQNVCVLWGVGNHGGGPSKKDLQDIKEMINKTPDELIIHSYPEKYFDSINPKYTFDKSLRTSMPGCYTSMGRIKRKHIKLENELYLAEKMCSIASLSGLMDYPEKEFNSITEDLLNSEFHDILPGSSVQCGEENGSNLLGHGILDAERLKTKAFFALTSGHKQAAEGEYPVFVFNPQPFEITENVEVEFMLADQNWSNEVVSSFKVFDEDGNQVNYQMVKEESNLNLDWRKRIIIEAKLKPLQMNRFSVYCEFINKEESYIKQEFIFNNGKKYVEIDNKTGLLKLYKIDGVEYINNGFLPVSCDDNSDPWGMGSFQLKGFNDNEKEFILSQIPDGPFKGLKSIQVIENGPICLSIESFFEQDNTRTRVCYKIYKNNNAVDIDVTLFLNDIDRIIKLKIPVSIKGTLIGQTAFGTEELFMDGIENPSHRFIALKQDDGKCLAVINNCLYGNCFKDDNIYLSLARGVSYCAHPILDRPIIPTDRYVKKIDQGENNFSFRIDVLDEEQLENASLIFNQKPFAINAFPLTAGQDVKFAKIVLSNNNILLSNIKKADNNENYIIRLFNNLNKSAQTHLIINDLTIDILFNKYEVKNYIYDGKSIKESKDLII